MVARAGVGVSYSNAIQIPQPSAGITNLPIKIQAFYHALAILLEMSGEHYPRQALSANLGRLLAEIEER